MKYSSSFDYDGMYLRKDEYSRVLNSSNNEIKNGKNCGIERQIERNILMISNDLYKWRSSIHCSSLHFQLYTQ